MTEKVERIFSFQNIFMLLNPPSETSSSSSEPSYTEKSVVVLSTKLDGVNLFENAEIGAESPSTGEWLFCSSCKVAVC